MMHNYASTVIAANRNFLF